MSARDPSTERRWLIGAQRDAGAATFAEHAARRLAAGETTYGDRWTILAIDRLLAELAEEAADLGAWGVLALQALEREPSLAGAGDATIARRLHGAILAGARAHRELELARADLHRQTAGRDRRRFAPDVDGRCVNCDRPYSAHPGLRCPRPAIGAAGSQGSAR